MNAPHPDKLIAQTFNSKFIEFVWNFDNQVLICKIELNPMIYMEAGEVNAAGDFIEEPNTLKVGYGHIGPDAFITEPSYWSKKQFPEVYKNFDGGRMLVPLVGEVVYYLKSI
jgi:hypothetical protein